MRRVKPHFPHIVLEDKKEVWFYVESGYPTVMVIPILTKQHYPDYKGVIASRDSFMELSKTHKVLGNQRLVKEQLNRVPTSNL